jgi:ATP-dependent Clp protease ATP-binding subunit ClpC
MFERYTETARRSIFLARVEATEAGSAYIETDHLLLGLLRISPSLYGRIPPGTDVDVRREILEGAIGPAGDRCCWRIAEEGLRH